MRAHTFPCWKSRGRSQRRSRPSSPRVPERRGSDHWRADVMKMPGRIETIYVSAQVGEAQRSVDCVELVAGAGILGDRYYNEHPAEPGLNLTLIEAEEIERFNAAHGA